jgi:hypothetical protein
MKTVWRVNWDVEYGSFAEVFSTEENALEFRKLLLSSFDLTGMAHLLKGAPRIYECQLDEALTKWGKVR